MIESLYEENFAQGRLERTLNLPVTPVMDEETVRKKFVISQFRTHYLQVSKDETQKHFHTKVTLPVFELLARAFPSTKTPFLQPLQNVAKKEYGVDIPDSNES